MHLARRLALLFSLMSLASAEDWSGFLVDSKCYEALEQREPERY